jgi:NAD(P)-dependent dehydrogenase (short-subunit alcohol dehydrogenase family)
MALGVIDMNRLQGKIAVITGGNSGIGFATAQRFLEEGATVLITGRSQEKLLAAQKQLAHDKLFTFHADAASLADNTRLFQQVQQQFGGLDILFLNAGVAPVVPFAQTDEKTYDDLFAINVKGVFYGVQQALPVLRKGSSVIINSSTVNQKGMAGFVAYAATKAAVRSFARGMSAELAPAGIRVNCVSPGPIATPLWEKTGMNEEQTQHAGGEIIKDLAAGRFGTDREIADAVVYLGSDESRYVVGADLYVDGGMSQI